MIVVAWLIYQRISSDQPREVVAPFALTFAWVLVAPWVFPVVHRARLGRADPGSAQPDDPVADDRHGPARHLAFRRRAGRRTCRSSVTSLGRPQAACATRADGPPRPSAPPMTRPTAGSRAAARSRRHWLVAALLAAGLVLRVLAQFAYRPGAVLHRLGEVPVQLRAATIPRATSCRCGRSCSWPTSTRSSRSSICSAWPWPLSSMSLLLRRGVSALAGRARDRAGPARRLSAAERADDHAGHLVRGPDRRRHRHLALAARRSAGGGSSAAGIVLGTSATVAQVGEALIPAAAIFVLAAAAAAGAGPSARRPRCARRARCPSWPTAPAPT